MQSSYARTSASSKPLYSVDSSQFSFPSHTNDQETCTNIDHGDDVLAATPSQHYPTPVGNTDWMQQSNIDAPYELETQIPQMQNKDAPPWDPLPAQRQQHRAANPLPSQYSSSQPNMPHHQTPIHDWTRSSHELDFNTYHSSQPTSSNYEYTNFAFGDGMGRSPTSIPRHLPESSYTASTAASETEMLMEGESFYQQSDDLHLLPGNQNAQAGINLDSAMEDAPSYNYPACAVTPYDIGIGDHLNPQLYSYPGTPFTGSLPTGCLHQSVNAGDTSMNPPTFSLSPDPSISLSQQSSDIADRRSSSRHEGDVPGSYPPTAHHYPVHHSIVHHRLKDDTRFRPRSLTLPQNPLTAARRIGGARHRSSNSGSNLHSRNKILEAIDEDREARASDENAPGEGEGNSASAQPMVRTGSGRPKRDGPLPEDVRRQTGERRKDKNICINCKATRISCDKCDEDVPCESCSRSRKALVCVPAEWSKHVLNASCDSLFDRTVQYQNSSTGMPTTKLLPPTFKLSHMLNTLHKLRDSFRIRVRHVSSFTYLLDLDTCYGLLSSLKKPEFELKDIFHGAKPLEIADKWAKAVIEWAAHITETERLFSCMLMPGMADFELVPCQTANLPRWAHEDFHTFAATLNRIPLRAFEILGHNALQKACNSLSQTSPKMDPLTMVELGRDLGKVVCSLRLQQAWSFLHDSPLSHEQQRSAAQLECLTHVTRSLYFWYIRVQEKIDRKMNLVHNSEQNYFEINGKSVADPLPVVESEEQYRAWCRQGQAVLFAAGLGGQAPFSNTYRPSPATAAPCSGMH